MTKPSQTIQIFVAGVLAILTVPAAPLRGQTSDGQTSATDRMYHEEIRPILVQHCLACHDAKESSAGVILERYATLLVAGPKGRLVQPGDPDNSRLIQAIRGENGLEKMPPEDQPPMPQEQIDRIVQWVRDGAPGSDADLPLAKRLSLKAPAAQHGRTAPITSLVFGDRATAPWAGRTGAIGRWDAKEGKLVQSQPWVGKVNQMRRSVDGSRIAIASGLAGDGGPASVLDAKTGELICQVEHPKEMISTAVISPDGKLLASGSYDAKIDLWEIPSGKHIRSFAGHHGPIGDLDFDSSSTLLASASRDETIKLWRVDSAERLDTLGQAEDAQRSVRFDPSGNFILGASDDRRIRIWKLESRERPAINPWLKTVFAHEAAVHQLWIDPAGRLLVSLGEDRKMRGWKMPQLESLGEPLELADLPMAIEWSDSDQQWIVPLIDGTVAQVSMPQGWRERLEQVDASATVSEVVAQADQPMEGIAGELVQREEQEPNGDLVSAMPIEPLAVVRGSIDPTGKEGKP
ncbi:MAG: c-type cytochrome domain-containing protein, partial [Pirellulaceae bacterium]